MGKNSRLVKNTLFLYFRSLITVGVSLFTSRVVLEALGIDNYGIYNVVGGFVAMFSIISSSLTASISRYLTYSLGKGTKEKLATIFSTSINIQIAISIIVILFGSIAGILFINYKMNLPTGSVEAARWVLFCSIFTFCINLISVPYNAAIIAHERMSAFAYISILEVFLKLGIVYLLYLSPCSKLVSYAILMACVSLLIRLVYGVYCKKHFDECRYHWCYDKKQIREMTGFAGWTFFTNGAMIFNTQGVNILINIFFGVTLNASRGIATQVEAAVSKFTGDFMTALNPQITKSYASGDYQTMYSLICRGAKFSFFLFLCIGLPIIFEAGTILHLWLKEVPDETVVLVRLSIICSMITALGHTGYIGCIATGNIKKYSIIVSMIGCLVFPLTWISYSFGTPVVATYFIYGIVYLVLDFVRLWILKGLTGFPPALFIKSVFGRIVPTVIAALIVPSILISVSEPGLLRLLMSIPLIMISSIVSILLFGVTKVERKEIIKMIALKLKFIR